MAKNLKYYYDFLSQPSRSMYIILKLSKTPFEPHPVALNLGENLTDEFKEINRFQKVPCIVHNEVKLAESVAILRYLHDVNFISETLYPSDLLKRSRVDEFLEWQHLNIRLNGFLYFQHVWLRPMITGDEPIPKRIKALEFHLNKSLDVIEQIWLKSNNYMVSNELTAADIFAASEIMQTKIANFDPLLNRPKIKAWLESVRNKTNPYFDEAHQICDDCKSGKFKFKL